MIRLIILLMVLLPSVSFALAPGNISTCGYLTTAGTYTLTQDVASTGSCFFITHDDVVLDLNSHTVTFDNGTAPVVTNGGFESGTGAAPDNWNMTSGPHFERAAGTTVPAQVYSGSYGIKVSGSTSPESITSAPVTLAANTTYNLVFMLYNKIGGSVIVTATLDGTAAVATSPNRTTDNLGFWPIQVVYTTGATDETRTITLTVTGNTGTGIYIDDVTIQRTRLGGVVVGPPAWAGTALISDVTAFGNANRATIKNGAIVQGSGNSDYSYGAFINENSQTGHDIDGVTFTNTGAMNHNIRAIYYKSGFIRNSTFNFNPRWIVSRMAFDGSNVKINYPSFGSSIYGNTVNTGVQTAFYVPGDTAQTPNEVRNNTIALQTRYSNEFAIVAGGALIHDNIIDCGSGNNSCRGIGAGGTNTKTYDNIISVQELPRNAEYGGCSGFGAYGIQVEVANNVEIYGNTVTANAGACEAHAFRENLGAEGGGSSNVSVHDNTFTAVKNGTAHASSLKFYSMPAGSLSFYNNTMTTNDLWMYMDSSVTAAFSCNTWQTSGTLTSPFQPFLIYDWNDLMVANLTFHNNQYGTGDKARFESESIRDAGVVDPDSSITLTTGTPLCDGSAPTGDVPFTTCSIPSGRYTTTQVVTLTANEAGTIKYCLTPGCTPATTYTAPFKTLQNIALQTVRYLSVDTANNTETVKEVVSRKQRKK